MRKLRKLTFRTYELFRLWYNYIKTKYDTFRLVHVKRKMSETAVHVVVTY